jgi:hypothetical protein
MSKKPRQEKQYDEELSLKDDFKNKFKQKKQTQEQAHERRQRIRELKENRDWN